MDMPNFMFEPINPRLTLFERIQERLTETRAETMARKVNIADLKAARAKTRAAFIAYKSVEKRRDGTPTIKLNRLRACVTEQLRAENQCK